MELLTKETDFYSAEWNPLKPKEGRIIKFKHEPCEFLAHDYDWFMIVALEKAEKVTKDRHLLTSSLLIQYRNAIREGYQHQLDSALQSPFDYPRNRNTVEGIKSYIKRIFK